MKKIFTKSEIWFAIIAIIIYTVGHTITDELSINIGVEKSITFLFDIIYSIILIWFIKKNKLNKYYGLCKPKQAAKEFLFYVPLIVLSFHNIFFGIRMNMPILACITYIGSMMFVGFLEEIIFRGFLFNAIRKDNEKIAIIVSSITFGLGHLIYLINGSGADIIPTLCQAFLGITIGYLFVIVLLKGKSLIPCIITHSLIDMTSAFANDAFASKYLIQLSIVFGMFTLGYSIYLRKKLIM